MNKQKTNEGMKWWGYLICLVIIAAAIFMLLDMIKTFTSKSTSIGFATETKYFESAADIDVDVNQSSLQLNEESGFYEYKTTIKAVNNFDGTKKQIWTFSKQQSLQHQWLWCRILKEWIC